MAKTIEELRALFPEDLRALFVFEDKGETISVKPKEYMGSQNFAKSAAIIRNAGGEYISAGKASFFRVPKAEAEAKPADDEVLPRVYRKANTVVVKLRKTQIMTATYLPKQKAYLCGISKMAQDGQGNPIIGDDKRPVWEQQTVRLSLDTMIAYKMQLHDLIRETQEEARNVKTS